MFLCNNELKYLFELIFVSFYFTILILLFFSLFIRAFPTPCPPNILPSFAAAMDSPRVRTSSAAVNAPDKSPPTGDRDVSVIIAAVLFGMGAWYVAQSNTSSPSTKHATRFPPFSLTNALFNL